MMSHALALRPAVPRWIAFPVAIGACALAAVLGSLVTAPEIPGWYAGLAKPRFNPPNWVFPVVWPILYAMMAVAAARVATLPRGTVMQRRALGLFAVQLVLNVAWSFAFFGRESPEAGLLTIVFLLAAIAAATAVFARLDRVAGLLMLPYLAWTGFAALLNGSIVAMN